MHVHIRRQRPLLRDEKAATKSETDKPLPGQLLAQGSKLACCVDRVGVQTQATCSHGALYDADKEVATRPREAALVL